MRGVLQDDHRNGCSTRTPCLMAQDRPSRLAA
jgi:hypothetical protein